MRKKCVVSIFLTNVATHSAQIIKYWGEIHVCKSDWQLSDNAYQIMVCT